VIGALLISLLYLLHIRILDDRRDFKHDSLYHRERPVQKGIITLKELWKIDAVIIPVLVLGAIYYGTLASLIMISMISYSFLAEKNFFLDNAFKKHFLIYNFVNTIQTFILQLFVYTIFTGTIPITILLITHYAFTCTGTIIFEFVRKVKLPKEDGAGRDTYTWHLGFQRSIIAYVFLAFTDFVLFFKIMTTISNHRVLWLPFSLFFSFVILFLSYLHLKKRTRLTEVLLQMSFLLTYTMCNLLIFFSKYNVL
jgi:hypothetical protein